MPFFTRYQSRITIICNNNKRSKNVLELFHKIHLLTIKSINSHNFSHRIVKICINNRIHKTTQMISIKYQKLKKKKCFSLYFLHFITLNLNHLQNSVQKCLNSFWVYLNLNSFCCLLQCGQLYLDNLPLRHCSELILMHLPSVFLA